MRCKDPWLLIGDLNEVTGHEEKYGGRNIWKKHLYLKDCMKFVGGVDLGYMGSKFTYENNQEGQMLIKERLDWVVTNKEWLMIFQQATVKHLNMEASDHCPILLQTNKHLPYKQRPFRFLKAWTTDLTSRDVVDRAWNTDSRNGVCRRLVQIAKDLKIWNRRFFGYAHIQIQRLEKELEENMRQRGNENRKKCLQEHLKINRDRLESIYRQQSRQMWLKERDKNTTFFKLSTLIRRRHNRIMAIKNNGVWIQEEDRIAEYFIKHFEDLFESSNPNFTEDIKEIGSKMVTVEENIALIKIPSIEEIKKSIWELHQLKSPRSDGFPCIFYRSYWRIIKERIVKCMQDCFHFEKIEESMNKTFIVLIPKTN